MSRRAERSCAGGVGWHHLQSPLLRAESAGGGGSCPGSGGLELDLLEAKMGNGEMGCLKRARRSISDATVSPSSGSLPYPSADTAAPSVVGRMSGRCCGICSPPFCLMESRSQAKDSLSPHGEKSGLRPCRSSLPRPSKLCPLRRQCLRLSV